MQHEFPVVSLLLITALAATLPLMTSVLRQLHIPLVVVEILAGIVVGRSGLNLIDTGPRLEFLAMFGFAYLMFLSGLELDAATFSTAVPTGTKGRRFDNPLAMGLATFTVTTGGALLAALGLWSMGWIQHPFMMSLILSTTSLGIVVPVLKERGLTTSRYGQMLLVSAVVADFGTMLLITVAAAAISRGLTLDLLLILLLLVGFAATVRVGQLATRLPGLQRLIEELAHTTTQIQVRGTFALLVGFIALSKWLGTEIILGAFLAGAVISLLTGQKGSLLHMKIDAIGFGFFIPIFFIMVGVHFDLPALWQAPEAMLLVPLLLAIAYAVKLLAALLYRLHFSWRETLAAGMLLSSRLSLIIAAASIALELGAIDAAINSAIILLALITCTLSPVLFTRFLPPPVMPPRRGILLVGLGQLSVLLAERLHRSGEQVTLVGADKGRMDMIRQRSLSVIGGDPTTPETLRAANAASATALMALSSRDEVNLAVCRLAQARFDLPCVIALANDPVVAAQMSEEGIRVIQPQLATVLALEGALHFPTTFDMLTDPAEDVTVIETLLTNPLLNGRPLRRIRIPGDALVIGLRRDGDVLVPRGDTVLYQGDVLMLVGHPEGLQQATAWINSADDDRESVTSAV
jgi:CPA2 family monovalent cation:H+ antiporter-2